MNKTITTNFNHGVGFQGDLPIPFDIILNVSAWVIILTFVFLKISWKESILTSEEKLFSNEQTFLGKFFGLIILFLYAIFLNRRSKSYHKAYYKSNKHNAFCMF